MGRIKLGYSIGNLIHFTVVFTLISNPSKIGCKGECHLFFYYFWRLKRKAIHKTKQNVA